MPMPHCSRMRATVDTAKKASPADLTSLHFNPLARPTFRSNSKRSLRPQGPNTPHV